jgi:hypothetical protein
MPKFIMSYYIGPNPPSSPEEGAEHMARYQEWMMKHQDALVEPENPLMNKRLITESGVADGGKPGSMMGYGIIQADSIEAAEAIAKTSPFLAMGDIELAQIMEMPSS